MKKLVLLLAILLGGCFMFTACGQDTKTETVNSLWDFKTLSQTQVEVTDAGYAYAAASNVKAVYFKGAKYNGQDTNVFAYLGVPTSEKPQGGYPAIVLVHGGLGRAFPDWVKLWTDRGYVAISLSVEANITDATNANDKVANNPNGGPKITMSPSEMRDPENSWEYISVANVIYCHNILRSMENVNPSKIGITGISWGSFLTCITVGVDDRFAFAIPVYGAGYNHENVTGELAQVFAMDDEALEIYKTRFDPSVYMKNANLPMLWITGANDIAFALPCNQKCANLNKGANAFSWRDKLVHGQQPGDGTGLPEVFLFADYVVKGEDSLLRVAGKVENGAVTVTAQNDVAATKAEFYWTSCPLEYWHEPVNELAREEVTVEGKNFTVAVPEGAVYGFMQITDLNGNIVSSELFSF